MVRRHSLIQRLTLFFTVLAAVVVLGLGLVFIQATEQHFVELDRGVLQDKQHLIEGIVQSANSFEDIRRRLGEALSHHEGLYVIVKDLRGQVLYESENFRAPESATWPAMAAGAVNTLSVHWRSEDQEFRATAFTVMPAYDRASPLQVLATINTAHHEHFLAQLRRTLTLYALAAVVVSGLLGWLAAHQGLAPLRAMRARAAAVSGHPFNERMPVSAVPMEMANLAAELNSMLDRLQEDYRRLGEFSSDLAHELRTPISNLLTQTQVALSAKRDVLTYRSILASNAEELERMARMVADMLFLAKAERGIALPNREHFSIAPEVQALLEFYDAVAEEKDVKLRIAGEGTIDGDRLMFRRAISNLLSNAVRHSDQGSEVVVTIEPSEREVAVCVENMADDIPPAALPRLFDRFFRIDPSRAHSASEGAGLGLSITKAIVEAHAGDITATSEGRQIRMTMRFPTTP